MLATSAVEAGTSQEPSLTSRLEKPSKASDAWFIPPPSSCMKFNNWSRPRLFMIPSKAAPNPEVTASPTPSTASATMVPISGIASANADVILVVFSTIVSVVPLTNSTNGSTSDNISSVSRNNTSVIPETLSQRLSSIFFSDSDTADSN